MIPIITTYIYCNDNNFQIMSKSRHADKPTAEDLWTKLQQHQSNTGSSQNNSNAPTSSNDVLEVTTSSLVFIGDYQSGKSTLISIFQKPTASSYKDIKPTIALDYSFARRTANNVKSVANFWEIGEITKLAGLLSLTTIMLAKQFYNRASTRIVFYRELSGHC